MGETVPEDGPDTTEVTTDDVVAVFKHHESPAITSRDVSVVLGCSRDVARRRLQTLADRGEVKRHKSGNVVLWWHPTYVDEPSAPEKLEPVETGEQNSVEQIEANPQPDSFE
jgi:hypothetical protein